MKIAIDISPLESGHRVRGVGFYLENLKKTLVFCYPQHSYVFFTQGQDIPQDVDLVHYPYFDPFFLTLPYKKKQKTVVTVHDLTPLVFPQAFPSGLKGRIKWQIQKKRLQNVDAIITDSHASKKDIIKIAGIPEDKVHVVYLAAGEEFQVQSSKSKVKNLKEHYNLPEKFLLYVGDVTWNKNLPRLLEAVKKNSIPLVMVGKALTERTFDKKNPWNKDLVKVHQLAENDDTIIRLGFVPTEDLVALYNTAVAFVMPSLYEGFGLPILEAMSCGCPVITTKESSLPEVAGEAAFYVDAYDSNDIADGIKRVFGNEQLQKDLSQKGLAQAKKFSWKKTAGETIQVYETIC